MPGDIYREASCADALAVLLLHGFPTARKTSRDLMPIRMIDAS
jgi:hypothetical protein